LSPCPSTATCLTYSHCTNTSHNRHLACVCIVTITNSGEFGILTRNNQRSSPFPLSSTPRIHSSLKHGMFSLTILSLTPNHFLGYIALRKRALLSLRHTVRSLLRFFHFLSCMPLTWDQVPLNQPLAMGTLQQRHEWDTTTGVYDGCDAIFLLGNKNSISLSLIKITR